MGAHRVVASHPLRMRKALGSNPSVSISIIIPNMRALLPVFPASALELASLPEMCALPFLSALCSVAGGSHKEKKQAWQRAPKHGKGRSFDVKFDTVRRT